MDAHRAGHLGEPRDRFLDLLARHHHQVRKFVDNDHDVWQRPVRFAGLLVELLDGIAAGNLRVVPVDVSHAPTGEVLVPPFHLGNGPFQRDRCPFRIGDDRRREVRYIGVQPEFEALRVDHDELHLVRPRLEKDRHHERIHADGFTRTRRTRDQKVRHLREVGNVIKPVDGLSQRDRQQPFRILEFLRFDHLAQHDRLAPLVRDLDPDESLSGNTVDADRFGTKGEAEVIDQARHTRILHARVRLEFVRRDHRPGADVYHLTRDIELFGLLRERFRDGEQLFVLMLNFRRGSVKQLGTRQYVAFVSGRLRGHYRLVRFLFENRGLVKFAVELAGVFRRCDGDLAERPARLQQ